MKQLVLIAGPLHGKAGLDAAIRLKEDIGRRWPAVQAEVVNTTAEKQAFDGMKQLIVSQKLCSGTKPDTVCVAVLPFCLLPGVEYERVCRLTNRAVRELAAQEPPSGWLLDGSSSPCKGVAVKQQPWKTAEQQDSKPGHGVAKHSVWITPPLLSAPDGIRGLVRILGEEYPAKAGEALVLVGHDSRCADACYQQLKQAFHQTGRRDVYLSTLGDGFDTVREALETSAVKTVRLVPLMLSAGIHTMRDVAGEQTESWNTRLRQAGFSVRPVVRGLAELHAVRDLLLQPLADCFKAYS
ncbi:MAG: sirohydrochlorin cobaltochelatase [Oscillospiraceae bacterium]